MRHEEIVQSIIDLNRSKFWRKLCNVKCVKIENAMVEGQSFYAVGAEQVKIKLEVDRISEKYKVIYKIKSESNVGTVSIEYNDNKDIGNLSNEDIVFFIKNNNNNQYITISIASSKPFFIEHIEIIAISEAEYKCCKYKQYLMQAKYLIDNDMNLKRKAKKYLKENGLKNTLIKVKEKLQGSSTVSAIEVSNINHKLALNSKKEKVIVVVHEAQNAGATLLSMNIIDTISKVSNYEPVVILMRGGPLEEELRKKCTVYSINQTTFSMIQDVQQVRNIIQEITSTGVKYAICNTVVSGLLCKELHEFGVKTITLVHELPTSIITYDFMTAANYTRDYSDKIVFAANFVKDKFKEAFGIQDEKYHILPQGMYTEVSIDSYSGKSKLKAELVKKVGIEGNTQIVLGCGYGNMRKGLDIFATVASRVIKHSKDIHFIWLGNCDVEMKSWIEHDIKIKNIDKNFHFIGFDKEIQYYLGGADIFFLPSREDPFPSVVLGAMALYTPVIAFENGGGAPEALSDNRGVVLPYLDEELCEKEIISLLNKPLKCKEIALNAKEYINNVTPENYVKNILELVTDTEVKEEKIQCDKKVSVIIPNYNYENFLQERLDSIINQNYKPYEIIFLDDCSKDNSVEKAKSILENCDIPYKVIPNTQNNGCFKQWIKGINEAKGEIIWIAEADDSCEQNFLEKLVPNFIDDQVNLAYGQSEIIDEYSNKSGYVYTEYTKTIDENKWNADYVNSGQMEIRQGLGIQNTIPNASGTLIRKSALANIEKYLKEYTIAGDWFTYVYAIKEGKIAFCKDILNYHRRHSKSIISKCEQKIDLYIELIKIKKYIAQQFLISADIKDRFLGHVASEYERLSCKGYPDKFSDNSILCKMQEEVEEIINKKISNYSFLDNKIKKNILFVAPDLEMGGGQMLVVRLANYLCKFHNVYLYNARPWLEEERVLKMIDKNVSILESNGDFNQLNAYIKEKEIEAVNHHIWWADKIVHKALKGCPNVRNILAMHGCYEALLENPDWDIEFEKLVPEMFERCDKIIYATQKNTKIFESVTVPQDKIAQVYYGYEKESIPKKDVTEIGVPKDAIVMGIVSRGIKEKGWAEAIAATIKLNEVIEKEVHLILIGNSDYEKQLKDQYKQYKYIHFIDDLSKPSEWIGWVKTFNIGLLPTYFISESLPNTIIEYLAYNVPVISTNIGEIKNMLISNNAEAGIVLELKDGKSDVEEIVDAMKRMIEDEELYKKYQMGTKELFKQFDINNFVEAYYKVF